MRFEKVFHKLIEKREFLIRGRLWFLANTTTCLFLKINYQSIYFFYIDNIHDQQIGVFKIRENLWTTSLTTNLKNRIH
jgi:hypothetical protein